MDLVPDLVETVKGVANFEQKTMTDVVEARAKATQITLSPEMLNNPNAVKNFQKVQGELGPSALSRLMAVSENYPDLKANQNFLSLQSQLEGTENRISVARRDYIEWFRPITRGFARSPASFGWQFTAQNQRPNFLPARALKRLPPLSSKRCVAFSFA